MLTGAFTSSKLTAPPCFNSRALRAYKSMSSRSSPLWCVKEFWLLLRLMSCPCSPAGARSTQTHLPQYSRTTDFLRMFNLLLLLLLLLCLYQYHPVHVQCSNHAILFPSCPRFFPAPRDFDKSYSLFLCPRSRWRRNANRSCSSAYVEARALCRHK